MTHAWVRVSATDAKAMQATAVLPVPTSPRSKRFITCRPSAMSAKISATALSCSSVNENGSTARIASTNGPTRCATGAISSRLASLRKRSASWRYSNSS